MRILFALLTIILLSSGAVQATDAPRVLYGAEIPRGFFSNCVFWGPPLYLWDAWVEREFFKDAVDPENAYLGRFYYKGERRPFALYSSRLFWVWLDSDRDGRWDYDGPVFDSIIGGTPCDGLRAIFLGYVPPRR